MSQKKQLITFNIDSELYTDFKNLLCILEDRSVTNWLTEQIQSYVDQHKDALAMIEKIQNMTNTSK